MPRWIQKINEDGTSKFVPADQAARRVDGSAAVQGDIESFVSPIDGTVISDRKQYREHMRKHGVVPASEFSQEFYERKAKERARVMAGEHDKQERLARRQEINEIINHLERR
jgi:hypothetical protein